MKAAPRIDRSMWRCLQDYGKIFRPWLGGLPLEAEPIDGDALAPLFKVIERYGTRSALAWVLSKRPTPGEVGRYVDLTLLYSREKAARRRRHILALSEAINGAGVEPLLLKGSAMQIADIYPDPGFRLMTDIDLLVPSHAFEACERAAAQLGFAVRQPLGRYHANQQYHAEGQELLELHRYLTRWYYRDNFPPARLFDSAHTLVVENARMLVPDWPNHAAVVILHAFAWDDARHKALVPLKALLDLACLKVAGVVEWDRVSAILEEVGEIECLIHAEALFGYLFGLPLAGVAIAPGKRRRLLAWYALGANHRRLTQAALAVSLIRSRISVGIRQPAALRKLLTGGFYRRLAKSVRYAFDARNPHA